MLSNEYSNFNPSISFNVILSSNVSLILLSSVTSAFTLGLSVLISLNLVNTLSINLNGLSNSTIFPFDLTSDTVVDNLFASNE